MIIGSILLGVVVLLAVLGLLRGIFTDFKVSTLVAIIVLVACPLLMLIPDIRITDSFYLNLGGYIIPMIAIVFIAFAVGANKNLLRAFLSSIAVAFVVAIAYLFIPMTGVGLMIGGTLTTGIIIGGIAFLISGKTAGSFISVLFGVMLADVAVYLINMWRGVNYMLIMGNARSFDVWVIGAIVAVGLCEIARAYRASTLRGENRHALNYEFGQDLFDDNIDR